MNENIKSIYTLNGIQYPMHGAIKYIEYYLTDLFILSFSTNVPKYETYFEYKQSHVRCKSIIKRNIFRYLA